jgi:hypothetical protein
MKESKSEYFDSVIARLKKQGVLTLDLLIIGSSTYEKEFQMRELFRETAIHLNKKQHLNKLIQMDYPNEFLPDNLDSLRVMSFAQLTLYKILPCPDENCLSKPREVITNNKYRGFEYQCPFYHHTTDKRRLVIPPHGNQFLHLPNYGFQNKTKGNKKKYSQNYFESMFHPLYYKKFECKKAYCTSSMCPFVHSEEEKKSYERSFTNFMNKNRNDYFKGTRTITEIITDQKKSKENHYRQKKSNQRLEYQVTRTNMNDSDSVSTNYSEEISSPRREQEKIQEDRTSRLEYNPWAKSMVFDEFIHSNFFHSYDNSVEI